MAKRASPGIGRTGHNSGMPTHADVRSALAVEMIFAEEERKLREKKKRARKGFEAKGVRIDDLNFLKGMQDMTGTEVVEEFKRHWHLIGAVHEDQHEQLDIFAPKPAAPAVRAAHFTMGLLAGLRGQELEVPPAVVGDERQQMMAGYDEGRARYAEAWEQFAASDGVKPVDGTGKAPSKVAAAVAEKAAKDFAADQGDDPLTVGGHAYPTMRQANAARKRLAEGPQVAVDNTKPVVEAPVVEDDDGTRPKLETLRDIKAEADAEGRELSEEFLAGLAEREAEAAQVEPSKEERSAARARAVASAPRVPVMKPNFHDWGDDWQAWTGPQQMEFRRWFESVPRDFVPLTTHEGAVNYFRLLREEQANRDTAGPDDEPVDAEFVEVAPAPQVAEVPDAAEVEAAAKKLAESGFVPKAGRKSRNLAK